MIRQISSTTIAAARQWRSVLANPTNEVFVIQLADRVWDVKFKVDDVTFKPVIAAMAGHQDAEGEHSEEAKQMALRHGVAIVRACSEFCELNLLSSPPGEITH